MTPAEHAATEIEVYLDAWSREIHADEIATVRAHVAALAAQAETAEELQVRLTEWETSIATEALRAERDEAQRISEMRRVEGHRILDERDDAVQDLEHQYERRAYWRGRAEQARNALQQIADYDFPAADEYAHEMRGIARAALTENEGCEYHRPLFVKGCRDCAALTEDST